MRREIQNAVINKRVGGTLLKHALWLTLNIYEIELNVTKNLAMPTFSKQNITFSYIPFVLFETVLNIAHYAPRRS